ncbi:cytoplasmic polyadenylation element-binding protein-like [Drosophila gunungcola]|uniref:cytoplasmic polyadenylation element-binding protein-like n=1 Tax=Drosophila gunungcola TaxID=103775 RepID=UPI0022E63157|nr:cytoplasmic polyadenylation element-binding protein-like [Drosophila gunungcola]
MLRWTVQAGRYIRNKDIQSFYNVKSVQEVFDEASGRLANSLLAHPNTEVRNLLLNLFNPDNQDLPIYTKQLEKHFEPLRRLLLQQPVTLQQQIPTLIRLKQQEQEQQQEQRNLQQAQLRIEHRESQARQKQELALATGVPQERPSMDWVNNMSRSVRSGTISRVDMAHIIRFQPEYIQRLIMSPLLPSEVRTPTPEQQLQAGLNRLKLYLEEELLDSYDTDLSVAVQKTMAVTPNFSHSNLQISTKVTPRCPHTNSDAAPRLPLDQIIDGANPDPLKSSAATDVAVLLTPGVREEYLQIVPPSSTIHHQAAAPSVLEASNSNADKRSNLHVHEMLPPGEGKKTLINNMRPHVQKRTVYNDTQVSAPLDSLGSTAECSTTGLPRADFTGSTAATGSGCFEVAKTLASTTSWISASCSHESLSYPARPAPSATAPLGSACIQYPQQTRFQIGQQPTVDSPEVGVAHLQLAASEIANHINPDSPEALNEADTCCNTHP